MTNKTAVCWPATFKTVTDLRVGSGTRLAATVMGPAAAAPAPAGIVGPMWRGQRPVALRKEEGREPQKVVNVVGII